MADSVGIDETVFQSGETLSNTQCNRLLKAVRRNTTGDFLPRYYLLPACERKLPSSYLDFQRVFTIPSRQVTEEYLDNRVVRILSPWREQIVAQYSGYSMRVGIADYAEEDLRVLLNNAGLNLPPQ